MTNEQRFFAASLGGLGVAAVAACKHASDLAAVGRNAEAAAFGAAVIVAVSVGALLVYVAWRHEKLQRTVISSDEKPAE